MCVVCVCVLLEGTRRFGATCRLQAFFLKAESAGRSVGWSVGLHMDEYGGDEEGSRCSLRQLRVEATTQWVGGG